MKLANFNVWYNIANARLQQEERIYLVGVEGNLIPLQTLQISLKCDAF